MTEVLRLRSGPDPRSSISQFSDLKDRLEQSLNLVQTLTDLETVIGSVNDLLREQNRSLEEKNDLKRIRQRAYDRRRNFKPTIFETMKTKEVHPMFEPAREPIQRIVPATMPPVATPTAIPTPMVVASSIEAPDDPATKIWQGVQKGLGKIDGERLVQGLPSFAVLATATLGVAALVWSQSVELYKASGFDQPHLAAAGAMAMILGFAAIHASSRSWIALLLCLYAAGYESYFMISGTVQNEAVALTSRVDADPELKLLIERAERSKASYLAVKSRYDDPTSGVHGNDWFKKKHVDPAWEVHEKAQSAVVEKRNALTHGQNLEHVTWLKIMYRLGLVFLCMILMHKFVRRLARA